MLLAINASRENKYETAVHSSATFNYKNPFDVAHTPPTSCYQRHITLLPTRVSARSSVVPGILRLYHRAGLATTVIAGAGLAITYCASM